MPCMNTDSLLGLKSFRGQVPGIRLIFVQERKLDISKVKYPHKTGGLLYVCEKKE